MAHPDEPLFPRNETETERVDSPSLPERVTQLVHEQPFGIPDSFCVAARAYESFVADAGIRDTIHMELGRKPFEDMRWVG